MRVDLPAAVPDQNLDIRQQLPSKSSAAKGDPAKERLAAKKVAREFESLFAGMMLKSMRETVGKDKLTGGGEAEGTYRMLLDQEYAARIAESGSLGLAKMIEKQLLKEDVPAGKVSAKNMQGDSGGTHGNPTTVKEDSHEN